MCNNPNGCDCPQSTCQGCYWNKNVKKALNELIDKYIEKIGTMGEVGYNEELDNLCSDIYDLKESI